MVSLSDFAGGQNLRFFKIVPKHVDRSKAPGRSSIPAPTGMDWVLNALMLRHVWASPNTIWSLLALAMYFLFPYDLRPTGIAASAPLSIPFFALRAPLWLALTFGYTAFWHITLYWLGWAERPFATGRVYNWGKIAHNLFYSTSGVLIWTGFENVFAYLWATGRLAYVSDEQAWASPALLAFILPIVLIPVWRDAHFYFAHRLLHFKPLYIQVHSLHHRNTDIEPFSGLTMHPIEHLYYYACILPSLVFVCSPLAFLWNGVHLLLSPGASHSGWEDHFQADAFHYMHHRYFECNYAGLGAAALDVVFNTFREKFPEEDKANARADAKSTLVGLPTASFATYMVLACGCVAAWAVAAVAMANGTLQVARPLAIALSFAAGFGPVLVAVAFSLFQGSSSGGTAMVDPKLGIWPTVLQLGIGNLFCSVPVMWACYLALQPAHTYA